MSTVLFEKENPEAAQDDVGLYLQEIRRYPRLTIQQERQLAMGCAEGDEEAIRQMVVSNLRLVVRIAREYAGRGVPLLDLIQEGSIGLLAAAKKFDYTLDYRFSTYATKWIRQGIGRCLLNHSGLIRVPRHTQELIRKVLTVRSDLEKSGLTATVAMIAEQTRMPQKKVEELLQLIPEVCSLDAPVGSEEESALQLLLEDIHAPQPQEELVRQELKHTLDSLLSMLTERQQQILRLHFGMDDGLCRSLAQIAEEMGISKERVRQIEKQAMEKLRAMGAGLGLEDYLE